MSLLSASDKIFSSVERGFLGGVMIFTSLFLFVNVIMRYFFLFPIFWAEELVRYLMVWMIFVGASQVTKFGGHVAVDIVPRLLSRRVNTLLAFVVNLVCIFFCLVLAYYSLKQMLRVRAAHQISPAMEIPMWIAYLSIPLGTVLMLVRYVQQIWLRLRGKTVEVMEVLD